MPHDPTLLADTRAWLRRAAEDLRAATFELTADPPLSADVVFHAQQSAEKAMKGLLTWHDVPFRKTHDLAEIGRQCVAVESTLEPICRRAERLTVYAWAFRYPGDAEQPEPETAREELTLAREVFDAICARPPVEARP